MTCFSPIEIDKKSKSGLIMGRRTVPCGRCNGCRIARSKEWAIRCIHETKTHDDNCFITLTYNPDHLPPDNSLEHKHFQDFIRSLRKRVNKHAKKYNYYTDEIGIERKVANPNFNPIRYYMCGEYGKATEGNQWIARPHFHVILFGFAFQDKTNHTVRRGNQVYRSELLERTWTKGFSEIGNVTFKSCAYVARYIIKKQKPNDDKYAIIDNDTGEILGYRKQEYTHMSLKPGIGNDYYYKYETDNYEYIMLEANKKMEVPRYYKNKLKVDHPILYEMLRLERVKEARKSPNNSPERLAVRNHIQGLKLQKLKRDL